MKKIPHHSPNLTDQNIEKLLELFPNVSTETRDDSGEPRRAIDFDLLRQELSDHLVEGPQERYQLDWPGKRQALLTANAPIPKTLRPVREQSVDFDSTKNLFIEGDNLDALKLLQESYLGKVKLIYIDPPYNTGKDFVYRDHFAETTAEYLNTSQQVNEEGMKLRANPETDGRYHSNWLSMIYPRLKLARNLLAKDGVIFISIDDFEMDNLRKVCNEIFGEHNSLTESPTSLIWPRSGSTAGHIKNAHEYILCYARDKSSLPPFRLLDYGEDSEIEHSALKRISKSNPESTVRLKRGMRFEGSSNTFSGEIGESEKMRITGQMKFVDGQLGSDVDVSAGWAMKEQLLSWLDGKETFDSKGQRVVEFFFNESGLLRYRKERSTIHPRSILSSDVGTTKSGTKELKALLGDKKWIDYPKPVGLLRYLLSFSTRDDDLVLDFFGGSGTMAEAVWRQNAEDNQSRRWILIQLPEATDRNSDAFEAGFNTISELALERIRRAGSVIEESLDKSADSGFRALRVAPGGIEEALTEPNELKQETLLDEAENVQLDRTPEDLLFECMIDLGLELNLEISHIDFQNREIFMVDDGALIACFANDVDTELVQEIASREPLLAVFRDSSFSSDQDRINAEQIFKEVSPATEVKVI